MPRLYPRHTGRPAALSGANGFAGHLIIREDGTFIIQGPDGVLIVEGVVEGDPPVAMLRAVPDGRICGDISYSESPDGATVWCDTYPVGNRHTIHA